MNVPFRGARFEEGASVAKECPTHEAFALIRCYFVPKILSPASPRPGTM